MGIAEWWGENWEKTKEAFAGLGRTTNVIGRATDISNIAMSSLSDPQKTRSLNAYNMMMDYGLMQVGNAAGTGSLALNAWGVRHVGAALTWANKTLVNRPLATLGMVASSTDLAANVLSPDGSDYDYDWGKAFGTFYDTDTWRKAWNDSRRVTAGQALTYDGAIALGIVDPADPNYDPRKSKEQYYNDWFFRTTSGSIDFLAALADPSRGVSKIAKASKLRYLEGGLTANQIRKGGLERQIFGSRNAEYGQTFEQAGGQLAPGVQRLYEQARTLDADTFTRLYFNNYAHGGTVGTALHAAAADGDMAAFADVLMSARGSRVATERLATRVGGAALADAIGRQRNPWNIANITERFSRDRLALPGAIDDAGEIPNLDRVAKDRAAWESAEAQAESGLNSVTEQMVMATPAKYPTYGTLSTLRGAMIRRGNPKVRPQIDALKIGIHRFQNDSYVPLQTAPMYQRAIVRGAGTVSRVTSSARGYAAHLFTNEAASFRQFRSNLERAGKYIDDDTRNLYVQAYMAALTGPERARIAGIADNYVIGRMAQAHGLSAAEAERLIKDASYRRQSFRTMLGMQQKFLPDVFVKRANELLKKGAREEASKLQDVADQFRAKVAAGQMPGAVYQGADDMGRPIFIIDNKWENPYTVDRTGRLAALPKLTSGDPLLVSQTAERLPMVDYQAFDRALRRFAKPRMTIERYEADRARELAGEAAEHPDITHADYLKAQARRLMSTGGGLVDDVYEALNHVWSVGAVLRPAQTLRTLADDGTRSLTMIGLLPTLVNGGRGVARIAYRTTRRGMTWAQDREYIRSRRAVVGRTYEDVAVDGIGPHPHAGQPESESSSFYNYIDPQGTSGALTVGSEEIYPNLESALVSGRIDLDTFIAYLPWAARNGRVPTDIDDIVTFFAGGLYGEGLNARRGLRREVLQWLADNLGTAQFTYPRWQADTADLINEMGMIQRNFRKSNGMIINPMSDEVAYSLDREAQKQYEFVAHRYLHRNPATSLLDDYDGIYDFVADHAEKFLFGNYRLHAKIVPDGRVRLSVVRDTGMPRPIAERMTAQQRRDTLRGLKGRGSAGTRLVDGEKTVTIPGVFSGMDGDWTRSAVSSQQMPHAVSKGMRAADRAYQWNKRVDRGDVTPYTLDVDGKSAPNRDWAPAWEESVNMHLANDEVARRFLEGREEADVLHWLDSDAPDAARYLNDRPKLGLSADRHVSTVRALVDYLVPPEAGQPIRDNILRHEAKAADAIATIPKQMLPTVNGEVTTSSLMTHPAMAWTQKQLDRWFRWMQDKPADFLVRYPFVEHRYKMYFDPLFDAYKKQLGDGVHVEQEAIDQMARMARQSAIDDTKRYLYDQTFRTDLARALSAMMPFPNAIADSLFKWLKIAREKPLDTLANWNLIFNWPERNGLVYDQDGNSLHYEDGKEVWRSVLDGSVMSGDAQHDKYVAFQVPSWLADKIPGGLKLVKFNKSSMTNAIFDPSVNIGPLLAFPMNQFALTHPEFGDNRFIRNWVLPFGPQADPGNALLPGLVRSAYQWHNQDYDMASSATMAIFQTQMTDFGTGKRASLPSLEEARIQAGHEQGLRFMTSALSPISFQYNTPYQPFIDAYSQLLNKHDGDASAAMTEFREKYGDDYIYLAARVTKSNIALPATLDGYRKFKEKQEAINKYPDLAGLITGGDGSGSFSKSVYEWEKQQTYDDTNTPIRTEFTVHDSIRDVMKQMVWDDWTKYNAQIQNDLARRGLKSIEDEGAQDIKERYAYWITAHQWVPSLDGNELELSPWYKDFKDTDNAKMEARLLEMQQLLMDHPDWMQGRDELQGLAQYLDMRRTMKSRMDQLGYATLDSQKAKWLQDLWEQQLTQLRDRNVPFGQLYARWLVRDNLGAQGLAAEQIIAALEGAYAEQPAAPTQ